MTYSDFAKLADKGWSERKTKFQWNGRLIDKALRAIYATQYAIAHDRQSFTKEGANDVFQDINIRKMSTRRMDSLLQKSAGREDNMLVQSC